MITTGAAILGAGLLGAGASIWGANKAASAQQQAAQLAAQTQQQGQQGALALSKEALDFQKGVYGGQLGAYGEAQGNFQKSGQLANDRFNETRGNLTPWLESGKGANALLSSFYGLDGNTALGDAALARFAQSPDYKFALQGGTAALDNSASAKGSLLSGNQLRAVTEYGQGLATQNLGQYLQRLGVMSGQGMQAAGQLGQFGAQHAAQQGTLGMQLGQLGTNLGTGVSSVIGSTTGNAANNLTNSANQIGQSQMAAGTAEASGVLGTVKGINAGLNSLSLYNQLGKTSYGGGMGNPMQLGSFY